jgi:hypothetical protein
MSLPTKLDSYIYGPSNRSHMLFIAADTFVPIMHIHISVRMDVVFAAVAGIRRIINHGYLTICRDTLCIINVPVVG